MHHAGVGSARYVILEFDGNRSVIVVVNNPEIHPLNAFAGRDGRVALCLGVFAKLRRRGFDFFDIRGERVEDTIARLKVARSGVRREAEAVKGFVARVRDAYAQPETILPVELAAIVRAIGERFDGEAFDFDLLGFVGRFAGGSIAARFALLAAATAACDHRACKRRGQCDCGRAQQNLLRHGFHHSHHFLSHRDQKPLSLRRPSRQFGFQGDCAAFTGAREVLCGPNGSRAKSQTAKRGSGRFGIGLSPTSMRYGRAYRIADT